MGKHAKHYFGGIVGADPVVSSTPRTSGVFNLGALGGDGASSGGDANWGNVTLLLDGSSKTTDASGNIPSSNITVTTGISETTASLDAYDAPNGDVLDSSNLNQEIKVEAPTGTDLFTLNSDFTLEAWVQNDTTSTSTNTTMWRTGSGTYKSLIGSRPSSGTWKLWLPNATGNGWSTTGATLFTGMTGGSSTWYHVAVTKSGSTYRGFVNGVQTSADIVDATVHDEGTTEVVRFGAGSLSSGYGFDGRWQDIRITRGVARDIAADWTAGVYNSPMPQGAGVAGATRPTRRWGGMTGRSLVETTTSFAIDHSLDFDGSGDYLEWTPTVARGSNWTFSVWLKRASTGTGGLWHPILESDNSTASDTISIYNDQLYIGHRAGLQDCTIADLFQDTEWHHLVISWYSGQSTIDAALKIYLDGNLKTISASPIFNTRISPSTVLNFGTNVQNRIGGRTSGTDKWFDGQLAEVHFIDGQALDATYFGETVSGTWYPKEYSGTYGTNGFYLDFADNSTAADLGTDVSGNSNNFAVTGLSTGHQLTDAPAAAPVSTNVPTTGVLSLAEHYQSKL